MGAVNIFDVLLLVLGAYIIYTAIVMKKAGKISPAVVMGKDIKEEEIKDKEGFLGFMFSKVLLLGIFTLLAGIIGIVNQQLKGPDAVYIITMIVYMIILVLYALATNKAKKMYM